MTNTRLFALVYGIAFLGIGVAGFIPAFVQPGADVPPGSAGMETPHMQNVGLLFGMIPVNTLHNIVHLAFGIWGLAASRNARSAWIFAVLVAVVYLAFALMGLASGLQTAFGLVPLYGAAVFLHLVLFAGALFFAITGRGKWEEAPTADNRR